MSGIIENDNGIIQNQIPNNPHCSYEITCLVGDDSPAVRNESKDRNEVCVGDPVGYPSSTSLQASLAQQHV